MSVKSILKAFWTEFENYDGNISCRKTGEHDGATFYAVETDGNSFEAVVHASAPDIVFFRGEGLGANDWRCSDGLPVVEVDGVPYIAPGTELLVPPTATPSFIAKQSGLSVATIYNYAKRLGRLPTVEEALKMRKKAGAPKKYK